MYFSPADVQWVRLEGLVAADGAAEEAAGLRQRLQREAGAAQASSSAAASSGWNSSRWSGNF